MFFQQFGKTDDRIHGRPDIMAHIEEEARFCLIGQLCFFRLYTISLGVGLRNKKARANRTAVAALLAREALPYFQSGALQRAAALAIFRGLCRCVNEYARANPSKLS